MGMNLTGSLNSFQSGAQSKTDESVNRMKSLRDNFTSAMRMNLTNQTGDFKLMMSHVGQNMLAANEARWGPGVRNQRSNSTLSPSMGQNRSPALCPVRTSVQSEPLRVAPLCRGTLDSRRKDETMTEETASEKPSERTHDQDLSVMVESENMKD